jgi:amino acid adenylation domain-containing protein
MDSELNLRHVSELRQIPDPKEQDVLRDNLVHNMVQEQVECSADRVALSHGSSHVTYAMLEARSNQLARYLVNRDVGPDDVVGIHLTRSVDMIIALLGVMKAGAAYLPLDPSYPPERLAYMLDDANPKLILSHSEVLNELPSQNIESVALDRLLRKIRHNVAEPISNRELGLTSALVAYVIYTSGSTGKPKGIAMAHRSLVNLLEWHDRGVGPARGVRVLQFAALSFDVSFQEIFSTLCGGGTLFLIDEWMRRDFPELVELLTRLHIERVFIPPMVLQGLAECISAVDEMPLGLRDVIAAGEQLRISPLIAELFRSLGGCRLHNHYGPTESHVVTALTLAGNSAEWPSFPSIGYPISNVDLYVLDERLQRVPFGEAGEIYIGGVAVAQGYRARPELTALRFVPDSFGDESGGRLYRTGDLGRWLADGSLEYVGRNDHQVKIRGYRIELPEIETRLREHVQIGDAIVIACENDHGQKYLVAYFTSAVGKGAPGPEVLRAYLEATLPDYMIPAAFVALERMPLLPNGKLDRHALPEPDLASYVRREYEAPRGGIETATEQVWCELLGMERVGRNDNFFELGGHSLMIVRMVQRLQGMGLTCSASAVYSHPTLAALAGTIVKSDAKLVAAPSRSIPIGCQAITPEMLPLVTLSDQNIVQIAATVPGGQPNIQDIYPLAPLQEGILFHHLLNRRGGDTYVLPTLISIDSSTKLEQFCQALQKVVDRHDALRTAVLWEHLPQPVQVVYRRATVPIEPVCIESGRDALEQMRERMFPQEQRLDIRQAPLIRLQIAKDPVAGRWLVLLQLHHLICDHESLEEMLAEVDGELGTDGRAPSESVPYRNHVAQVLAYQRSNAPERFFLDKLKGVTEPSAPFGLMDVHGTGAQVNEAHREIESELGQRIRLEARKYKVSAAALLHAAWALTVSRLCGRDDVVFGTLLLGRSKQNVGTRSAQGLFINTLPLRVRLAGMSARGLVAQVQRELAELMSHEQASLAVAQRCSQIEGAAPLFSTLLNFLHGIPTPDSHRLIRAPGVHVLELKERTNYPISVSVTDTGTAFSATVQADPKIDPSRILDYITVACSSLADALRFAPETPSFRLEVVPVRELYEVTRGFNLTPAPYPKDEWVHRLFEQQAQRTPDAVAIADEKHAITYSELDARANSLAADIIQSGVRPGERVAVLMRRSPPLIVTLLAILKSGAVYVPLDPLQPPERQTFVLNDSGSDLVISDRGPPPGLHSTALKWIQFDEAVYSTSRMAGVVRPQLPPAQRAPAYLMYTSGSTGVPKGVIVPHRAVTRLVINNGFAEIGPTDCIAHCSNPAFDALTFEVWGALLNGAKLLVIPDSSALERQSFERMLRQHGATILLQTTALFNRYATTSPETYAGLRYLLFGGESADARAAKLVLEAGVVGNLLNVYGPTETTTLASAYPITGIADGTPSLPIGRPISNTTLYILDSQRRPAPIGVAGEIYIGGAGVALGYHNRPELTADRFVDDPYSAEPNGRLYRSGDLGRWRLDGNIEFLGRNDRQIKLRGFRIEPGEIEAHLVRHPSVKEAIVVASNSTGGDQFLIAYLTPSGTGPLESEQLREYLSAHLPEYMRPSAFVILDEIPLTPNGKVNLQSLPAPVFGDVLSTTYESPQGEVEIALASIWQDVLGVPRVGRHDRFFELGGHSLLAMKLTSRVLSEMSVELSVSAIFECRSLAELAARISELRESKFNERLNSGGSDIQRLLERVASMKAGDVHRLMTEMTRSRTK